MDESKKKSVSILTVLIQVAIIAIPTYTVALFTEKMVYVVPTLVISGLISNHFHSSADHRDTELNKDVEIEVGSDRPMLIPIAASSNWRHKHIKP